MSGDIASLSIDAQEGSGLGKITAIRQPGGTPIVTPQSTVDIHYTKSEIDTMLASLQAQVAVMSFQLSSIETLTFLGEQGGTPVPVHQIQVAQDLKWAYYGATKVLWIQQDDPLPPDPYYPL